MQNKSKEIIVAFDSNMLVAITQFKVDVFAELRKRLGKVSFVVPEQVLKELNELKKGGKTLAGAVKIAEELMKKNAVMRKKVKARNADDALIHLAKEGIVIASNDGLLRKRIKSFNGKIVYLRKKKTIVME